MDIATEKRKLARTRDRRDIERECEKQRPENALRAPNTRPRDGGAFERRAERKKTVGPDMRPPVYTQMDVPKTTGINPTIRTRAKDPAPRAPGEKNQSP